MRLMLRSWPVLLVGVTVWLVSCSDDDNLVVPNQTYDAVEELAKETFDNDAWIDRTVKPGDSFWHFAIGGWLKTRDEEDRGTINDLAKTIQEKLNQHLNSYDSPVAGKLFKLLTQSAPEKSEEMKVINDFLSTLKLDGDVSKADLIRNFGKLYDIGCPALVLNFIGPMDGQLKCILSCGIPFSTYFDEPPSPTPAGEGSGQDDTADEGNKVPVRFVLSDLMGLDFDSPDVKAKADDFDKIERKLNNLFYGTTETDKETGLFRLKRMQPATLQSLVSRRTRGDEGEDLKAVFNEAFHVEETTYVDEGVDEILAMLNEYSTDTWLLYQQYYVYGRFSAMLRFADYYDNIYTISQRVKTLAPSATFDYDLATLLKDCDTEGCREILENMRRRMSERIGQLDWLNSATKAKAQEKLQAMVFS